MKSVCSPGRQGEARGLFAMRRDGTFPRSVIVSGVQAALWEVRRGQTGLSLLCHWVWMHKRVKESETERIKKRGAGWCAFLTLSCGTQVTSHALKHTYASSTRIHSCAIHQSVPLFITSSSIHYSAPASRVFPQRTAPFQPVAQTSAITERVMLGLHRCARCWVLPRGSSSPQTGLHHSSRLPSSSARAAPLWKPNHICRASIIDYMGTYDLPPFDLVL